MSWAALYQGFQQAADARQKRNKRTALGNIADVIKGTSGNLADDQSYYRRAEFDVRLAQSLGITPTEFYGGGGPEGSSTSGTNAVLGNQAIADQQMSTQERLAILNSVVDVLGMENNQDVADTQADAQVESAQIAADASTQNNVRTTDTQRYTTDTQNALATKNYELVSKRMEEIEIPKFKQEMKISDAQYDKLVHEIATSDPKFQLYMKQLSMGPDNMLVEYLQHKYNIKITDRQSVQNMSESQRQAFIRETLALRSTLFTEMSGLQSGMDTRGNAIIGGLGTVLNELFGQKSKGVQPDLGNVVKSITNSGQPPNTGPQPYPRQEKHSIFR